LAIGMVKQVIKRSCGTAGDLGIGLPEQRVVGRLVAFLQRVRQGPAPGKVDGKTSDGVQPAVSEHGAVENVSRIQLRLGPRPGSSPIQQFPDYCELRMEIADILGLILSLSVGQDADNYAQTHSRYLASGARQVAEQSRSSSRRAG